MLQQLQKSQHVGLDDFIFGWPTPIDSEAKRTKKIFRETTASLVKFFCQVSSLSSARWIS